MTQSVEHRVLKIIAKTKQIPINEIKLEQSIEEIYEASIDMVSFLFDLEDEFDIRIPDTAKELKTIQQIITEIEQLAQDQQVVEET